MDPWERMDVGKSGLWGSKTVLGSSWFGSFFVLRFGVDFSTLLGLSWGRFGVLLGLWGFSWGRAMTEWEPISSSLLRFGVLLGLLRVLLWLCWGKMGPFFHLP